MAPPPGADSCDSDHGVPSARAQERNPQARENAGRRKERCTYPQSQGRQWQSRKGPHPQGRKSLLALTKQPQRRQLQNPRRHRHQRPGWQMKHRHQSPRLPKCRMPNVDSEKEIGSTILRNCGDHRGKCRMVHLPPRLLPKGTERILFVDSFRPTRDVRARVLREHGIDVSTAEYLKEARVLFVPGQYDLVLLDLHRYPPAGALVFCRVINNIDPNQRIALLLGPRTISRSTGIRNLPVRASHRRICGQRPSARQPPPDTRKYVSSRLNQLAQVIPSALGRLQVPAHERRVNPTVPHEP